jgi:hypothetical protein
MVTRVVQVVLALLAVGLGATNAPAQVYVAPYAGVYFPDVRWEIPGVDDDIIQAQTGAIYGLRLGYAGTTPWGVEAGYGFAPVTFEFDEFGSGDVETGDGDEHVLYGALVYRRTVAPAADLLFIAGVGAFRFTPEGDEDDDPTTDFMVELGAAVTYEITPSISLRADLRDHLALCSAETGIGDDPASLCFPNDEVLHNVELSGGVELRL